MKKEVILLALVIFLFPLASAEIFVRQIQDTYYGGDELNVSFIISPTQDKSGFFISKLVCENNTFEVYRATYTLSKGQEKEILVNIILGNFLIGNFEGECYVISEYGGESRSTQRFFISRKLDAAAELDKSIVFPGDILSISGEARKNKIYLKEGFVELSIPSINVNLINPIKDGKFNFSFALPSNAKSGNHDIIIHLYEKDNLGNIINKADLKKTITIRQLLKSISIAISTEKISPGENLTFKSIAYDQAKDKINTTIAILIFSPDGKIIEKKLVESDSSNIFSTKTNYAPGYWKIQAEALNITSTKLFRIEEYEAASFSLEKQILTIENIGNVPYNRKVEISIGNVTEIKEVFLQTGQSKKYKLAAPDGEYKIVAFDGDSLNDFGSNFLTGRAVSIEDIDKIISGNIYIILSLILILIICVIAIYLFRRAFKEKSLIKKKEIILNSSIKKPSLQEAKKSLANLSVISTDVVEKGEKQYCSLVALHIKNSTAISSNKEASETINSILSRAKGERGRVYTDGEYHIIVFSPTTTKEKENSLRAVKLAKLAEQILQDYNRRYAQKIAFGIGVNNGELIIESSQPGKLKFISVKNAIGSTKRLASISNNNAILSESVRTKTAGKIKVEQIPNSNLFMLIKVIEHSENKEFIDKFFEKNNLKKN